MVIGLAGVCLSDWDRTGPSRNNSQFQGFINVHQVVSSGRSHTEQKGEMLGAYLGTI